MIWKPTQEKMYCYHKEKLKWPNINYILMSNNLVGNKKIFLLVYWVFASIYSNIGIYLCYTELVDSDTSITCFCCYKFQIVSIYKFNCVMTSS